MTATVTEVRPAPPVRRDRVAMGWVAAVAASAFGDTAWLVALAWTAVQVLDPAAAGLVVGVGTLPQAALMLTGGVLADRHDPRRVVALGEAGRAAVLVAGALAWWSGAPPVVVLPGVALALGAVAGLTQPALQTMTRLLVRPDDLPTVMGWSQIAPAAGPARRRTRRRLARGRRRPARDDAPRRRDLRRGRGGGRDRTAAVRAAPHHLPRPGGAPGGDAPPLDDAPDPGAGAGDLRPQRVHRTGAHAGRPAAGQRGRLVRGLARGGRGGLRLRRDPGSVAALRRRPQRLAAGGFAALVVQGAAIALIGVPSKPVLLFATGLLGLTAGLASVWLSAAFIATVDPGHLGRISSVTTLGDLLVLPAAIPLFGALAGWAGMATATVTFGVGMAVLCAMLATRPELRQIRE